MYMAVAASEAHFCDKCRNMANFLCGEEKVKILVRVHFHCTFKQPENDKQNVDVASLKKFLRTRMLDDFTFYFNYISAGNAAT